MNYKLLTQIEGVDPVISLPRMPRVNCWAANNQCTNSGLEFQERARPFSFSTGKSLSLREIFEGGAKAKTRGNRGHGLRFNSRPAISVYNLANNNKTQVRNSAWKQWKENSYWAESPCNLSKLGIFAPKWWDWKNPGGLAARKKLRLKFHHYQLQSNLGRSRELFASGSGESRG